MAKKKTIVPKIKDYYVVITNIDPRIDLINGDGENYDMYVYDVKNPSEIDLDQHIEEDDVFVYKLTPLFEVKRKSTLEEISVDSE